MIAASIQPAARVVRRPTCNTAAWVDDDYARLLARQAWRDIGAASDALMDGERSLACTRKSLAFLREERMRVGPGFKMGTRVWLCTAQTEGELAVFSADFTGRGTVRRVDDPLVIIGRHFMERAFERFGRAGTNYLPDLIRDILAPLSTLARPEECDTPGTGPAAEVEISGAGRVRLETMLCEPEHYLAWAAKTFLPPKLDDLDACH